MKFFLDSANLDEIKEIAATGVLDGITTNPSLVSQVGEQKGFQELVKEICEIVKGPVSAEVINIEFKKMVKEAEELAKIHKHIVVKMPLTEDGIKATKYVSDNGINVNVTLVFSASQAILAAKAGAKYVSPFIGRLDDISNSGMQLVEEIVQIYDNYDFSTEILVASIRHPMHVAESALIGADVATMPYKIFKQLYKHPLSDIGLERFLADWGKK
jgi:transaldolase